MLVRPQAVRRLHRIAENATLVFASLAGLQDWTTTAWDTSGWEEDGNHLWTSRPGTTLNGDLRVPDRAVVEFEISWKDHPDFVFALGVDTDRAADAPSDGWRFETVGSNLAMVREQGTAADVDLVADLSQQQRIRLTAYLDQASGEMTAFLPDSQPAGRIAPASGAAGQGQRAASTPGRGVRLINRGSTLRLERLRIAKWLGKIPAQEDTGPASVALANGDFVAGSIRRLEADSQLLLIGDQDHESTVKLADVVAVKFPPAEPTLEQAQCALFLHSGMRISGNLQSIDERDWVISGLDLRQPMRVPRDRVRSMVVFQHPTGDDLLDVTAGTVGRLELDTHVLSGRLVPAQEHPEVHASCLRWQPLGSRNAATLRIEAAGRIVYRDAPRVDHASAEARAVAMQQARLQQQKRGLNFGELFLRRSDDSQSAEQQRDAHVVHIRSGDALACRVESIDEAGVHVTTVSSDRGFVPHGQVKAIELATGSVPPDLEDAKRDRLLTIPRLQKSSPPSHLLVSHNGDFLRGRLLRGDAETFVVEVQLEEIPIPRSRVAQLIWFHPDEVEPASDEPDGAAEPARREVTAEPFATMAQVLQRDGKRVTVDPVEVTDREFAGVSEVLGPWRVPLSEIDQLIFGSRIASEVADLAYNQWRLQRAVEPLAAQLAQQGPEPGSDSPLMGQDAPELALELLDGGEFRLSQCRGTIVVLDFWASWCAPCMQTMPLLQEAMAGFDPGQVRLLSINLEEPADHVRAVLERQQLDLPVALDSDGAAAYRYRAQAIPQLVIVGAGGKVERLLVGGGPEVIEQMKAAILTLLAEPPS
jgi:thiol-disulfide isomerase/thioredoxin